MGVSQRMNHEVPISKDKNLDEQQTPPIACISELSPCTQNSYQFQLKSRIFSWWVWGRWWKHAIVNRKPCCMFRDAPSRWGGEYFVGLNLPHVIRNIKNFLSFRRLNGSGNDGEKLLLAANNPFRRKERMINPLVFDVIEYLRLANG